jgi:hypothetical protein
MIVALKELKFSERLMALRTVDAFTVSRYRIAMRSGAKFPNPVIDSDTMEIVSGNHTITAMLAEFGDDHIIEVSGKKYKSEADKIADFARHNVGHGRPMDGWTQRKIALALAEAGQEPEAIAKLLNVPVSHLQRWGDRTVVVMGRDKVREVRPLKGGVVVPSGKMTAAQYERHADADIGMSFRDLANQTAERLEKGWYDAEDESEIAALNRLRAAVSAV